MGVVGLVRLVLAVAAAPSGAVPPAGLFGTVTRGPITPVCRVGTPCSEPAVGAVLLFSRAGRVARVTVGAKGAYRIRLAPGSYSLRTPRARIAPLTVRVTARWRRVDLSIDTGIR